MASTAVSPVLPAPCAGCLKRPALPAPPDGLRQRLAALRKLRPLTQLALAGIACGITQPKRYESGDPQATLDVIRRFAHDLRASAHELLFGEGERGPDADLRLQFKAAACFDRGGKKTVRFLLEGLILKHEAQRWSPRSRP